MYTVPSYRSFRNLRVLSGFSWNFGMQKFWLCLGSEADGDAACLHRLFLWASLLERAKTGGAKTGSSKTLYKQPIEGLKRFFFS